MKPVSDNAEKQAELRVQCQSDNADRRGIIKVFTLVKSTNTPKIL